VYTILKENLEEIKRSVEILEGINNKEDDIEVIKKCVEHLEALLVETPIIQGFSQFLSEYSDLIMASKFCIGDIGIKVSYFKRAATNSMTISEMNSHMRTVISRLTGNSEYIPDSWKLSRHYFELIEE
jgi:hypothetical protein